MTADEGCPVEKLARFPIEYRPWPHDPRYLVLADGTIIGPNGHGLQPHLNKKDGRLHVGVNGQTTHVSTIVCEAWHGRRPEGLECAHGDGNPLNNSPQNLRWATHTENESDKRKHGTLLLGERHHQAKLTEDNVREIQATYATGTVSSHELGRQYGVAASTILRISSGRGWSHIEGAVTDSKTALAHGVHLRTGTHHYRTHLTDEDIVAIREAADSGTTRQELAEQHGVTTKAIHSIITGRVWKHVGGPVDIQPPSERRRGEDNHNTPLTTEDVREIKRAALAGTSQRELGRRYGVSQAAISNIVRGKTWKHVIV